MRIYELEIFIQVVEAGGMTQAAALRGVTQPAISRVIRDLEDRVGVQLLRRTGRGVDVTPAGERFLAFAEDTLQAWTETERDVRALGGAVGRELKIAVPLKIGRLIIPALHKHFTTALPKLDLHVVEEASLRMADGLRARAYDIAVIYSDALAGMDAERLAIEQMYLAGLPEIVGENDKPITVSDLASLPLLLPDKTPFRQLIDDAAREAGVTLNVVRTLETSEAQLAFAMEGDGVCILPYSNVYRECAFGEVTARPIRSPAIMRHVCVSVAPHTEVRLINATRRVVRESLYALCRQARWHNVTLENI